MTEFKREERYIVIKRKHLTEEAYYYGQRNWRNKLDYD